MALVERVDSLCHRATDSRELRRSVLEEVRRVVGFDAVVWLLTDPETAVGSSPLAEVPCLPELPQLIRLKYQSGANRWTALEPGRVASLAATPTGGTAGEDAWREFLRRYDVRDVASVAFRDRSGCWGLLDLWRTGRTFEASELELLARALGPLTQALRRCQSLMFAEPGQPSRVTEPAVLLLAPDLHVRRQTAAAEGHLRALLPTAQDRQPVPATAYNVAAQLLAVEAGADTNPPVTRVALGPGQWWTFRAARLGADADGRTADVAVTIEHTAPRDRLELYCRAHGLTARESEILRCLADGDDTRAVSRRLHLSEFTVQDHLKSVFARTGVRSRRLLLARALG